jgi:hypothetical protein
VDLAIIKVMVRRSKGGGGSAFDPRVAEEFL